MLFFRKINNNTYFLREHSSVLDFRNLKNRTQLIEKASTPHISEIQIDEKKNGDLYIQGPFGIFDEVNLNDRRYKKDVMQRAIDIYNEKYIKSKRAVSELGHPDNADVNIHLISHAITEPLELRENCIVYGRAKVLPKFPMGDILYKYLKEGLRLGISSRGLGDVEEVELEETLETPKSTIFDVTDFELSAFDAVWEPSIGKFVDIYSSDDIEEAKHIMKESIKAVDDKTLQKILFTLMG